MVNKIETFKGNIEDRLNKLEAEIVLIKNKQNYLYSRINNNNNYNDFNNNSINNSENLNNNNINYNNNNLNLQKNNDYREINNNINQNRNINNIINKEQNPINKNNNNIFIQDSSNDINNNYIKNNQIFTSFAPEIRSNISPDFDNENNMNNKLYNNTDKRIYDNNMGYDKPFPEGKKVYNIFNYNQENENALNDKNKYADIDKLIENSEKNFFKTQKLLEDYDKK